jgi:hypothetical protein
VKKRAVGRQKSQGCRTRTCKVERVPTECVSGNWTTDQNDARMEDPDDIYRVRIATIPSKEHDGLNSRQLL